MSSGVKAFQGVFKTLSVLFFLAMLGALVIGAGMLFVVLRGLPDVSKLKTYHHDHATVVYSADGKKIGEFYTERHYPVTFEQVPRHVSRAFIAAEDAKFYQHVGIDFVAFARAAVTNILEGRYAQGASTITQQVARGILLESRRKKITRKLREMVLAWQMEKELNKDEILALYLNEIFLGHRSYGIGAAAQMYFHKNVEDLTLAEGAILAGLPQRPTYWNPFRSPHQSKMRQRYVLKRMVDDGYISEQEANEAFSQPLVVYPIKSINSKEAPYFTEYVRLYLNEKYGEDAVRKNGYTVHTTVRYDFQKAAEQAVDKGLRAIDKRLGWRGPIKHLPRPESVTEFLSAQHELVMKKVTPARVLPPNIAADTDELLYDTSLFEAPDSPFYGSTPIEKDKFYEAVILEVFEDKKFALASIGQTQVQLPFDSMKWVEIDKKPIKNIGDILAPGNVVEVRVDKLDKKEQIATVSLEQSPKVQTALLSYNIQTGFVEAMVGGRNFLKSPFNRALQAKRQVGSIFKPLIYAAAIDKGFSPASKVTDSPVVFKSESGEDEEVRGEDWRPRNYSERFLGELPLRLALIKSMNVPTIKILNEIGVDYGIDYARRLGIQAEFPRDLTIALGSWSSSLEELMRAYSIFPRLGKPVDLVYIKKVVSSSGEVLEDNVPAMEDVPLADRTTMQQGEGVEEVIELEPGSEGETAMEGAERDPDDSQVVSESDTIISPQTAYVMTDMLKGVIREGTGWRARAVPGAVAGKTGTSNDFHDAWFVGFTPYVMTGVWVGYDQDVTIGPGEAGGKAAAPIWVDFMRKVVPQYPREAFPIPENIVFASIDRNTGNLASVRTGDKARVRVAFKVGTVPDRRGANVPRILEPGAERTTTTASELPDGGGEGSTAQPLPKPIPSRGSDEDLSDLLREGYQ